MELLTEINTLLDCTKTTLPTLINSINVKTLSNVDKYFGKLAKDLENQKNSFMLNIQNEINKGIEMEYEIPDHSLIDYSVPYIQMKPDLYTIKDKINNFNFRIGIGYNGNSWRWSIDIQDFCKNFANHNKLITHKNLKLFCVPIILPKNEKIVYINFQCPYNKFTYSGGGQITNNLDIFYVIITYITNYGRFINKQFDIYSSPNGQYPRIDDCKDKFKIEDDILTTIEYNGYKKEYYLDDITEEPLTFKMPTIFMKIIDAINSENTELLQECFAEYHSRYIENKTLKLENKTIIDTIKAPYEDMKPKYDNLIIENTELKMANAKLTMELELLKIQMLETRKLYMQ